MNATLRHLFVMLGATALCSSTPAAQSRLFSYGTGNPTVREWNASTGAYMSNVLNLLNGAGAPATDQSDIEFDGVFFYSLAENDPRIRQYDTTGRYLRDFAVLVDGAGKQITGQIGLATDGKNFYTIGRNDPRIRKYDLTGRYIEDAGQLKDAPGPVTSQIGLAMDGQFFYTIAANDWRVSIYDLTGLFLGNVARFNRAGTPDGNNTGLAFFPPVARYTNTMENLIANGSFELPVLLGGRNWVPASALLPWQTTEDFFEVWGSDSEGRPSDGWQHLEILAQSASTAIWQTVPTIPNEDYALTFSHSPRPGVVSSLTVTANGQVLGAFNEDGSALTELKWLKGKLNFTAPSNLTTIAFSDTAETAAGTHIDNVVLQRLSLYTTLRVSEVEISWESVKGKTYQVQYRSALTSDQWVNLQAPIAGTGTAISVKDSVPAGQSQRFYRVVTVP